MVSLCCTQNLVLTRLHASPWSLLSRDYSLLSGSYVRLEPVVYNESVTFRDSRNTQASSHTKDDKDNFNFLIS